MVLHCPMCIANSTICLLAPMVLWLLQLATIIPWCNRAYTVLYCAALLDLGSGAASPYMPACSYSGMTPGPWMTMLNALEAILYCTGLHSWSSFSYTLVITLLYHARCLHTSREPGIYSTLHQTTMHSKWGWCHPVPHCTRADCIEIAYPRKGWGWFLQHCSPCCLMKVA